MREMDGVLRRANEMTIRGRLYRTARLDKASRERLDQMRRVDREDHVRYGEFLKGENTGIFKLFPDNGCVEKNLIRVDGDCTGFVPDSNYFLFRTGKYALGGDHDIGFYYDNFINTSFLTQTIMVSLGNEPIESVTAMHAALKLLDDFQPYLTPASASRSVSLFSKGVDAAGYHFADRVAAEGYTTYAIREIEFKAGGHLEIPILSYLKFKERRDSIYVFRVIRKSDDGSVTILWKQISRKNAPTIKFRKGDKFPDFGSAREKK